MQQNPIRLINMRYLNSIPYRLLQNSSDYLYSEGLPVECAAALLQKDADLALLPGASIFKHGLYELLDYGIISNGPMQSAYVFSNVPLEDLNCIWVDVSSETSIIVLKTIIAEFYPALSSKLVFRAQKPNKVLSSIRDREGGLMITDQAAKVSSEFNYTYDLGAEWKKHTGSPFMFAGWVCRPGTLGTAQIDRFYKDVETGLSHRALFARDWADEQGISREDAMRYVGETIAYKITPIVREAVSEFIQRASKHNLLPGEQKEVIRQTRKIRDASDRIVSTGVVVQEAKNGRRLSIGAALQLVEELPLFELAQITAEARANLEPPPAQIYHLSLEEEGPFGSSYGAHKLLSPDKIIQKLVNLPSSVIVILESLSFSELTLEYFEDLVSYVHESTSSRPAALSVGELKRISSDTRLPISEILARLRECGLNIVSGFSDNLLCDQMYSKPLEYLEIQREIARCGLNTISNLRISGEHSLLEYATHLFQLRQLQDQTSSIIAHFVDVCPTNTRVFSEHSSPGHYFRIICLSRLILDNVGAVAISPRVFGRPAAEVLAALGPNEQMADLSLLKIL
jgi:chorismate dehydratase